MAKLDEFLNQLIDDHADERGEVLARMAKAADIELSTVLQIIGGTIKCPPRERLLGFARVLGVKVSELETAALESGCDEYEADAGKSINLSQQIQLIRDQWHAKRKKELKELNEEWGGAWVIDIYDDGTAIVNESGRFFRIMYTVDDGEVTFGERMDEVERTVSYERKAFRLAAASASAQMNNLKAIVADNDELVVANYMILFNTRDLVGHLPQTEPNPDGSKGEYFSSQTEWKSHYTDSGYLHVDWEHGVAPAGEPQRHEVLGVVEMKSAVINDKGIFVKRILNRHNKYVQMLEPLIAEGIIGNSSEAVAGEARKRADGMLVAWPLMRDTLTVSPMEPQMKLSNPVAIRSLQALAATAPHLKAYLPEADAKSAVDDATVDEQEALPASTGDEKKGENDTPQTNDDRSNTMPTETQSAVAEQVAQMGGELAEIKAILRQAPADNKLAPASGEQPGNDADVLKSVQLNLIRDAEATKAVVLRDVAKAATQRWHEPTSNYDELDANATQGYGRIY